MSRFLDSPPDIPRVCVFVWQRKGRARLDERVAEMLQREVSNGVGGVQSWMGGAQQWFRHQYSRHILTKDERTIQTLYSVNIYLASFWAGSVLGIATGRRL